MESLSVKINKAVKIMNVEKVLIDHGQKIVALEVNKHHLEEKLDSIADDVKTLIKKQEEQERLFRSKIHDVIENMATNKNFLDIMENHTKLSDRIKNVESVLWFANLIYKHRKAIIIVVICTLGFDILQAGIDVGWIKKILF
jgi:hypothetical protein